MKKIIETKQELKDLILVVLEENKAKNCVIFDISKVSNIADYLIISDGTSQRHLYALSRLISENVKTIGIKPISISGLNNSDWVLIDFGSIIVNIMLKEAREYYDLDGLWGDILKEKNKKISKNKEVQIKKDEIIKKSNKKTLPKNKTEKTSKPKTKTGKIFNSKNKIEKKDKAKIKTKTSTKEIKRKTNSKSIAPNKKTSTSKQKSKTGLSYKGNKK